MNRRVTASDRKKRRCLRCDSMFMSSWAGHRICPDCHDSESYKSDSLVPVHRVVTEGRPRAPFIPEDESREIGSIGREFVEFE